MRTSHTPLSSPALVISTIMVCLSFIRPAISQSFDIRAQTRDRINALIRDPKEGFVTGKAFQGSFGAPSINDKGAVAYSCILGGTGIDALHNNSVVIRLKGKNPARVACQSGYPNIVDDGFGYAPINAAVLHDSVYLYRISRDVAINNNNRVAFAAQTLFTFALLLNRSCSTIAIYSTSDASFVSGKSLALG